MPASSAKLRDGTLCRPTERRQRRVIYENSSFAFLLNAPSLIAIVVLVGYPIAYSAWISLHSYNLKRPRLFGFVGLGNYLDDLPVRGILGGALDHARLHRLGVGLVVALGILIALLLNEPFPGRGFVRTMILLPWAIPPVVNGLMWQWIYDAKVGALNGVGQPRPHHRVPGWLSSPDRRRFSRWCGRTCGTGAARR